MKINILLFIIQICILLQSIQAQDFWEEVFTSGPTIFSMDISNDNVIYLGTANGIWKSFDNGDNWEFDTISSGNLVVYSLESKSSGIIYAGCNNRIFYSEDYGENWEMIYNGLVVSNIISLNSINNIILAGTWKGIIRSDNNGVSWEYVLSLNSGAESINKIIFDQYSGTFYAGSVHYLSLAAGGLYKSFDYGESWVQINVTEHFGINDIAQNLFGNLICAVIWDPDWIFGGIFQYLPETNTWSSLTYGERGSAIVVNSNNFYYSGIDNELSNGGCRVSFDLGETWQYINGGLSNPNIVIMDINFDQYLFSISRNPSIVFRSIEPTTTNIPENLVPEEFKIYPNPFNKFSNLKLESPIQGNITLEIYNVLGEKVYTQIILVNRNHPAHLELNNLYLNHNIYFFVIKKNNQLLSFQKLIFSSHYCCVNF